MQKVNGCSTRYYQTFTFTPQGFRLCELQRKFETGCGGLAIYLRHTISGFVSRSCNHDSQSNFKVKLPHIVTKLEQGKKSGEIDFSSFRGVKHLCFASHRIVVMATCLKFSLDLN
jgi:hypothetical protein